MKLFIYRKTPRITYIYKKYYIFIEKQIFEFVVNLYHNYKHTPFISIFFSLNGTNILKLSNLDLRGVMIDGY